MKYIKKLEELKRTDLPIAGGKGANLGELTLAGLPVPDGFVITTCGYRAFVAFNQLESQIINILNSARLDDPKSLDTASEEIQSRFYVGQVPADLEEEIRAAYRLQDRQPQAMAVRSSATAEDLPDMSFAGQQDTYLNILGETSLLDAVVRCWASLWTARAIGYRSRNNISHEDVSLAVVVQQMVQSEASGVLFTANPLTGKRSETVIDATLGLGEALVSGQVDPDHYVVDNTTGVITGKTLGAKAISITGKAGGGTVTQQTGAGDRQALPDEQILELARLGHSAESAFGSPQDMEWAWAGGRLYVVQSRPVTSLYPLPSGLDGRETEIFMSFGVWQGMLDPYTPAGQDVFSYLVAGFDRHFGGNSTPLDQHVLLNAGERLFVNLTPLLHNSIGRQVAGIFINAIDEETARIVAEQLKDPRFSHLNSMSLGDRIGFIRGVMPLAGNVIRNILFPRIGRARIEKHIQELLATIQSRCAAADGLAGLVRVFEDTTTTMPAIMMPVLVGGIAAGQAPFQIMLRRLNFPGSHELLIELTRGLPHNVTTQMDLKLWETAQAIKADSRAAEYFSTIPTDRLVDEYHKAALPQVAQSAVEHFMTEYDTRGVGEIDMGRPRWREHPSNLFQALKSYLQINPESAPDVMFHEGLKKAIEAEGKILAEVHQQAFGFINARVVGGMIHAFRELGGLRETPKFFVVRLLSIYRYALLAEGEKLVKSGVLAQPDDVMFLHVWELKALAVGEPGDWKSLAAERRARYNRELRRSRIPRILLSDGTAYYDAPMAADGGDTTVLTGSPVSAGVVEGFVRVVLDPHDTQLQPGDIMVCPATDPAWTPLFLAAGGLITEVGGMMTHGSVVAREYGIPAVVGVSRATERLQTGQRVRLDGSSGTVQILD
jgi:rifampicin phosphotransferase